MTIAREGEEIREGAEGDQPLYGVKVEPSRKKMELGGT
jgi:hypothetical protein